MLFDMPTNDDNKSNPLLVTMVSLCSLVMFFIAPYRNDDDNDEDDKNDNDNYDIMMITMKNNMSHSIGVEARMAIANNEGDSGRAMGSINRWSLKSTIGKWNDDITLTLCADIQ